MTSDLIYAPLLGRANRKETDRSWVFRLAYAGYKLDQAQGSGLDMRSRVVDSYMGDGNRDVVFNLFYS